MSIFKVGNRVRIKRDLAPGYIQPMRGWAEKGRLGTVEEEFHWDPSWKIQFRVRFYTQRPPKWPDSYVKIFAEDEIELAPSQEGAR